MAPSNLLNSGSADIKAASIVYEDTYLGGESSNDILGLIWLNEEE